MTILLITIAVISFIICSLLSYADINTLTTTAFSISLCILVCSISIAFIRIVILIWQF